MVAAGRCGRRAGPSGRVVVVPPMSGWLERLPVSFAHPAYLVLLVVLPLFYWLAHRQRARVPNPKAREAAYTGPGARDSRPARGTPRGPWPLALWLRAVVAVLVVLALSGLRL